MLEIRVDLLVITSLLSNAVLIKYAQMLMIPVVIGVMSCRPVFCRDEGMVVACPVPEYFIRTKLYILHGRGCRFLAADFITIAMMLKHLCSLLQIRLFPLIYIHVGKNQFAINFATVTAQSILSVYMVIYWADYA